jgi:2-amino-4-hydroxy-6-hydroxymethyldihydropteridine diphosphokinase
MMGSISLISLGANLGNAKQLIQLAGEMLRERFGADKILFSRLYRSPAVGGPTGQDDFYNAVATVESSLNIFEVWQALNEVEQALGRRRRQRWEARRIDLDILLHNDQRLWTPRLKVPHPRMSIRTFVLEPACEIAGEWIEPVTQLKIRELRDALRAIHTGRMPKIIVLSESDAVLQAIQAEQLVDENRAKFNDNTYIRQIVPNLDRLADIEERSRYRDKLAAEITDELTSTRLLAFAGTSPDPNAVHWEDYCRVWAEVLGMSGSTLYSCTHRSFMSVPKYLLSADDPGWAAHELQAAITAMTCPVFAAGDFFASNDE